MVPKRKLISVVQVPQFVALGLSGPKKPTRPAFNLSTGRNHLPADQGRIWQEPHSIWHYAPGSVPGMVIPRATCTDKETEAWRIRDP
jgi:hypothetical protein